MDAKPSYEKRTKKHFVYNRYYFGAYAIKANVNEEGSILNLYKSYLSAVLRPHRTTQHYFVEEKNPGRERYRLLFDEEYYILIYLVGEFKIKSDQFPEDVNPLRKWYKCKEHLHCRGQVDPFALHRRYVLESISK